MTRTLPYAAPGGGGGMAAVTLQASADAAGPVRSGASRQPTIDLRSRADRKTRTTGNAEPACTALRRTAAGIASVVFARREARSRAPNKPLNID
ncbi:hypothetical protein DF018_23985 [Burkholderia cenocepacia]|nr:hypothetical protein DF018_23985 [Burkholderia cenocepacia]